MNYFESLLLSKTYLFFFLTKYSDSNSINATNSVILSIQFEASTFNYIFGSDEWSIQVYKFTNYSSLIKLQWNSVTNLWYQLHVSLSTIRNNYFASIYTPSKSTINDASDILSSGPLKLHSVMNLSCSQANLEIFGESSLSPGFPGVIDALIFIPDYYMEDEFLYYFSSGQSRISFN